MKKIDFEIAAGISFCVTCICLMVLVAGCGSTGTSSLAPPTSSNPPATQSGGSTQPTTSGVQTFATWANEWIGGALQDAPEIINDVVAITGKQTPETQAATAAVGAANDALTAFNDAVSAGSDPTSAQADVLLAIGQVVKTIGDVQSVKAALSTPAIPKPAPKSPAKK